MTCSQCCETYERDQGVCQLCFLPVSFDDMDIDHIIPLAAGGTHEPGNVQVAHGPCNRKKGARLDGLAVQPTLALDGAS